MTGFLLLALILLTVAAGLEAQHRYVRRYGTFYLRSTDPDVLRERHDLDGRRLA